MTHTADPRHAPPTLQRDETSQAEIKRYKFRSLSNWLLLTRTLRPSAITLCVLGLIAGATLPLDQRQLVGWGAILLFVVSLVMFATVVQRNAFVMRFESGPPHLDLPRKLPTVLFVMLLFAPSFLFVTANAVRLAVTAGGAVDIASRDLALAMDPFERPPDTASRARELAMDRLVSGQSELTDEQKLAMLRRRVTERRMGVEQSLGDIAARLNWPEAELDLFRRDLDRLRAEQMTLLAGPSVPERSPAECDTYRNLCILHDRLIFIAASKATLGIPAAAVDPLRQWLVNIYRGSYPNRIGRASQLQITFSGLIGLFLLVGLGLFGATLIRVLRLSQGGAPYILASAGAMSCMLGLAFLATENYYPGDDGSLPAFGLYAVAIAPAVLILGFIRQLRPQGWGAHISRVLVVTTPLLICMAVGFVTVAVYADADPTDPVHTHWLLAAPFVFALLMWPVWVLFDRAIIRGNCKPKRFG